MLPPLAEVSPVEEEEQQAPSLTTTSTRKSTTTTNMSMDEPPLETAHGHTHNINNDHDSSNIRVCVRVRPLSRRELSTHSMEKQEAPPLSRVPRRHSLAVVTPSSSSVSSSSSLSSSLSSLETGLPRKAVSVLDDRVICFDPSDVNSRFLRGVPTHGNKRSKDLRYMFDRVFDEKAEQREIYEGAVRDLLDGVLDGYNATVFAYGATGAGKTFTISGTAACPGVMPMAMGELFERIDACQGDKIIEVSVSYLEIYNETIRDLLADDGHAPLHTPLDVREDASGRIVVAGLSEHQPRSGDQVMALLERGSANRTKCPTKANEDSSRSHAVFQINIQQRDRTGGVAAEVRTATLTLCDLAGSERASATENRGQQMREGANINRSLLALGNCINALCDETKKTQHIPYRDSKLTRLLKYSLGGNCRTVMIANVSPCMLHFEETHNTLKYANRAKQIKLKAQRNTVSVQYHVAQYVQIIEELRKEIEELRSGNVTTAKNVAPAIQSMTAVQRVILERRVAELRTALVDQSRLRTLIFVGEHVVEHLRLTGSRLHALFATADASVPSWLIMFDEALSRLDAEQQTREEEMRRSDATVLDIRKRAHPNVDEWERQTTIVERDVAQLTASALQRSMTMTVQNAATGSLCIVLANNDAVSEAVAIDLTAQLLLWAIESQQAVTAVFGQETVSAAATVPDAVDVLEATTTADAVAIEEEEKASQAKASVSAVKKPSRRKSLLPQPGFIKPVADLSSAEASGNRRQTIASLRRRSMLPTPLAKRRPPLPPTGQPIGGKPPLPPPTVTTSTIAESHVPVRNTRRQSLLPLHRKSSRATTRSQAQKASLLGSVNELENTISDAALKQELNELDSLLAAVSTPKKQQEVDGDIFDEVPVIHMGTLSLGQNKQHALPKRLRRIANDGENQAPPTNRGKTLRQAERCVTPIMDGKGSMASASTTITVTHSPSALRHYVNHHVAMSPQVGAAPFSPARKALMERHLNN